MPPPTSILCLRHAEKPPKQGDDEPPGLSPSGELRAQQLATALGPDGSLLPPGGGSPSHIFVPSYRNKETSADETESRRPYLTIRPLLESLERIGHPAKLVACPRDDVLQLAISVLDAGPLVVVCWEHDALAAWLQRFAGMGRVVEPPGYLPTKWDGDDFDVLWSLRLASPAPTYKLYVGKQNLQVTPTEPVYDKDGRPVGYIGRNAGVFLPA